MDKCGQQVDIKGIIRDSYLFGVDWIFSFLLLGTRRAKLWWNCRNGRWFVKLNNFSLSSAESPLPFSNHLNLNFFKFTLNWCIDHYIWRHISLPISDHGIVSMIWRYGFPPSNAGSMSPASSMISLFFDYVLYHQFRFKFNASWWNKLIKIALLKSQILNLKLIRNHHNLWQMHQYSPRSTISKKRRKEKIQSTPNR